MLIDRSFLAIQELAVKLLVSAIAVFYLIGSWGCLAQAQSKRNAQNVIAKQDVDGDGQVSRDEFIGAAQMFNAIDADGDGFATAAELNAFVGQMRAGRNPQMPDVRSGQGLRAGMGSRIDGQVPPMRIDADARCAFLRGPRCDIALAVGHGLFETGLSPHFPPGLRCRGIDDGYAIDYSARRDRRAYHGGIDMPAPFGAPIVASASGVVVSKSEGERGSRGREVILRHSPDDTGLPVWIYTQYAHLNEMPELDVGQRIEMGDVIGPTGNSGNGNEKRRPAVHFAAWFSEIPAFTIVADVVIPVDGHWMDPIALYRGGPPFDSAAMKALPGNEKRVETPVMIEDGSVVPSGTKVIWPYACTRS